MKLCDLLIQRYGVISLVAASLLFIYCIVSYGVPSALVSGTTIYRKGRELQTDNKLKSFPRILCWILTDPDDLYTRAKHVRDTWGRRCDTILFMSSRQNRRFPTIGLPIGPGRRHLAMKSKFSWIYIYKHYLKKADFFLKADTDTYIIMENLKHYLQDKDPEKPQFFGHRFNVTAHNTSFVYMSGGAGLVLSRAALRKLVEEGFHLTPGPCIYDGQGEDWKTALCLTKVGAEAMDTRDSQGKERFLVFKPETNLIGDYPAWFINRDIDKAPKGDKCCSDYPISFHYISPAKMYELEYLMYRARPYGKEVPGESDTDSGTLQVSF